MTSVGDACRYRYPRPSAAEEFTMTSIRPCLWFDGHAEEAAVLYVSLFPDSKIQSVFRYPEGSPMPAGEVATVDFLVAGLPVQLLNGGPHFRLSEAFSLSVTVDGGQHEVDRLWDALIADGGEPSQCGWLKDRFGVSWQIVPAELIRLQSDPDPQVAARVNQAMLAMGKIIVADIEAAAKG
jgi:predicted 3-demethylubiquinone-9 3-methyltransferase (glyoxalase superfamily)